MGLRLKPFLFAACSALAVVTMPALSQDEGWYIGAGGGETKFKNGCAAFAGPGSCDDNGVLWKVFGGYQLNPYFGVEIGYIDFGKMERTTTGVASDTFDATGFETLLVLTAPFTQAFGIYGKIGYYGWNVDYVATGAVNVNADTSGRDMTYGFGARYDLTKNIALRLEWQRYNDMGDAFTGNFDVDGYLLGITFKF